MPELTESQIASIKERFEMMDRQQERENIATKNNHLYLNQLVDLVNTIFITHGINETINSTQIRFESDFIGNILHVEDKKLSSIIFDHIYPPPTNKTFAHFTTFAGARNILVRKELWLFNLIKNFDAEEFQLFYEEHEITGYRDLRDTFGIRTDYRSLMSELFALCLTSDTNNSPTLWNHFGYGGTGIKLTFEIVNHIPDFREVYYSNATNPTKIPLLADLFDQITHKYGLPFNFSYMSKIGAYYIHGKFSNEDEYRFLVKRTTDEYHAYDFIPNPYAGDVSYIVLPFTSRLAEFKLTKVTKGPNLSSRDFESIKQIISDNYSDPIDIVE